MRDGLALSYVCRAKRTKDQVFEENGRFWF